MHLVALDRCEIGTVIECVGAYYVNERGVILAVKSNGLKILVACEGVVLYNGYLDVIRLRHLVGGSERAVLLS